MRTFIYTALFCLFVSALPQQTTAQTWGYRGGFGSTTGTDRCSGMALDAQSNLYITGSFTGSIDFGTGVITAVGNLDGFVAKFSPTGVCQWAIRFNGPGTAQDQGLGIATNGTSVFVGGVYQTSLSINGAAAITGYGGIDGFAFKLDAATGATQWATVFGSGSTDAVQAMCIDNTGNMYVTGYFSSNATYPTATFGSFTRSTNGGTGTDAYVAKLDGSTGAISWVSNGGMSGYNDNVSNSGLAYAPAQDAIVMVGSLQAPSAGTLVNYTTASPVSSVTLTSQGGLDIVVLKLDANNGTFQTGTSVYGASSSNEEALAAAYDAYSQKVVFTGYFNTSALTFGSNPAISPIGSDDIFYAAYDPSNNTFAWSKSAGSTIQDRGQSICTNGVGSVFLTGRYRNTMTAPTASVPLSIVSSRTSSADEIYLLQVSSLTGNAESLFTPVGDATITTGDIGTGVTARNGKVWLGGMFGGTISFPSITSMTTSGGTTADVLLARLDNAYVVLPVKLGVFEAYRNGNNVDLSWETTTELVTDYFEIERSEDGTAYTRIATRQANGTPSDYAWTDVNAMSNSTEYYYRLKMIGASGSFVYSPVIRVTGDRDEIFEVSSINPSIGTIVLRVSMPASAPVNILIADMSGRTIANKRLKLARGVNMVTVEETNRLTPGIYLVAVESGGQTVVQKIAKQ